MTIEQASHRAGPFSGIEAEAIEQFLIKYAPKEKKNIQLRLITHRVKSLDTREGVSKINYPWLDHFLETQKLPMELFVRLELIHRLKSNSMRQKVQNTADRNKFKLYPSPKLLLGNKSWAAWLILNDPTDATYEFLERVAFKSETEKRKVFYVARSSHMTYRQIIDHKFKEKIELLKQNFAKSLIAIKQILDDEIDSVCAFCSEENGATQIILRYPGRPKEEEAYQNGIYTNIGLRPATYASVYLRDSNGKAEVHINFRETSDKYKTGLRQAIGKAFSNLMSDFEFVSKLITFDHIWEKPWRELFSQSQVPGICSVKLLALQTTEPAGRGSDGCEKFVKRNLRISRGENLATSTQIAEITEKKLAERSAEIDFFEVTFEMRDGLKTKAIRRPVTLKAREAYKFDQRHYELIYAWLEKQEFIKNEK